jgi:hypothetical protein
MRHELQLVVVLEQVWHGELQFLQVELVPTVPLGQVDTHELLSE